MIEGSLEVKLPTIWTDGKAEVGRVREEKRRREKIREKRGSEERRCRCAKGRKVVIHCVFPMTCGSGGSKSRLAKAAGVEPSWEMRKEQLHAMVARSTFPSQNVQNTSCSEHFWKLRCRKSARRCGAKHVSKPKCTKHLVFGALLEVEMSKNFWKLRCRKSARLCGAKHLEVKVWKADCLGPLLEVWMWFCVACGRDSAPCQK